MHGEDCAVDLAISSTHGLARAERARRCQSPSYVSTDGAEAHGRTLIHDVIDPPTRERGGELVFSYTSHIPKDGGARRDRTDDLKLAKLALSQLSYGPDPSSIRSEW